MVNNVQLDWHLWVDCPKCCAGIDLIDQDPDMDYLFSVAIFNNKWDDLEGEEVSCPECKHEFKINKVEY